MALVWSYSSRWHESESWSLSWYIKPTGYWMLKDTVLLSMVSQLYSSIFQCPWFNAWYSTLELFFIIIYHYIKGALDKFNIIPQLFPKKIGIFIPLEVLAWVMTVCQVLRSRLTYFWRYMNISSIFYFSKSTSINTQYSSLWDTLKMMLFTKYLIKWKRIGRISWNFRY